MAFSKLSGLFNLDHYVKVCLQKTSNLHKWKELSPGQLQVAVTRLLPYFLRERATKYESEDDLLWTLVASAAAFPFAPLVYRHGSWCVDGGLSDFQPIIDDQTVTVSPFYFSRADIKPSRYVPLWWGLLPPNDANTIDWLYHLGWIDGLSWLETRGIDITCATNHPVRNAHPFDVPGRISLHRFLGYNLEKYGKYLWYFGDIVLYLLLVVIWKPLSLTLVYIEVVVLLIFHFFKAVICEIYDIAPMFFLIMSMFLPSWSLVIYATALVLMHKVLLFGHSKLNDYSQMWECIRVISSVELIVKFITTKPSAKSDEAEAKEAFERNSIFFRIAKHFL